MKSLLRKYLEELEAVRPANERGNPEGVEPKYLDWICPICKHEVMAMQCPSPIRWNDGHTCHFLQSIPWKPQEGFSHEHS